MPWDIVGQDHPVDLLRRTIAAERPNHAYLFVGPPRVGKRTLARALAQALNCEGDDRPCGVCRHCRRIAAGTHPDVFEVSLLAIDGRTRKEIGIDQMRDIRRQAHLQPYDGRYKVFLVDGADLLSLEAANALLKTLEEPPPHVVVCLIAAAEQQLLPTVPSRCQRIELQPIPAARIEAALVERWSVSPAEAGRIARESAGRLGWAVAASHDGALLARHDERLREVAGLLHGGRNDRLAYAAGLAARHSTHRDAVEAELQIWLGWWRDLLLVRSGCPELTTHVEHRAALIEQASRLSMEEIRAVLHAIWEADQHLRANVNPRLALDTLVLYLPER